MGRWSKLSFANRRLEIQPLAGDALLEKALDRENNVALLKELLEDIWGDGTTWVLRQPAETTAPSPEVSRDEAMKEASEDPTVQAVLEVFGGHIQSVQTP